MFRHVFFNSDEKSIFKRCYDSNKDETFKWLLRNILFPVLIICIPFVFIPMNISNSVNVQNILFHGSFSLIGINILFGMSSLLIKQNSIKSDEISNQVNSLKDKLNIYTIILIILSTIAYVFQVIKPTSIDWLTLLIVYTIFFIILLLSTNLGLKIYMTKDEYLNIAYADVIETGIKKHREDLDDFN